MNNIISFSAVSAATVISVGLGILIETALLKIVFSCLTRVKSPCLVQNADSSR